jgi:hypothetical protein
MPIDRGVQAALERKYLAVVHLEVVLRGQLTGTAADDQISAMLEMLHNEADALNAVIDGQQDPSIETLGPADATALQNAVQAAENTVAQGGAVQTALNAAAVLIGTLKQS